MERLNTLLILVLLVSRACPSMAGCSVASTDVSLDECPMYEVSLSGETSINMDFVKETIQTYFGEVQTKVLRLRDNDSSGATEAPVYVNSGLFAPLLRIAKGTRLNLTLTNLGNASCCNVPTNIHTHGLHIDPTIDDVRRKVYPGESWTYQYQILQGHSGGLYWYHAHPHSLIRLQVNGGLQGMLIIEDDDQGRELPLEILDIPTKLLHFQGLSPGDMGALEEKAEDCDYDWSNFDEWTDPVYFVNGFYKPRIEMIQNKWYRWRILHSTAFSPVTYPGRFKIEGSCDAMLFGRDGVYFADGPREVDLSSSGDYLTLAGRAEYLVRCRVTGYVKLKLNEDVVVTADIVTDPEALDPVDHDDGNYSSRLYFTPCLAAYLEDLRNLPPSAIAGTITIDVTATNPPRGTHINQISWDGVTPLFTGISAGEIWDLEINAQFHPMHIHVNHMQLLTDLSGSYYDNYKAGDFVDTIKAATTVRTKFHDWAGEIIVHCHILEHEDDGMMGVFQLENKNNETLHDYTWGTDICFEVVELSRTGVSLQPTGSPTKTPTLQPTLKPTLVPTTSPTLSPTTPTTLRLTMAPTAKPTLSPTMVLTLQPTLIPTIAPTLQLTQSPTMAPTLQPTLSPTMMPTLQPTLSPTMTPTLQPTLSPTLEPTMQTTPSPTMTPTLQPTPSQTMTPTLQPTLSPTMTPTLSPTLSPTLAPTRQPKLIPTMTPTLQPTLSQTLAPTKQSTPSPTMAITMQLALSSTLTPDAQSNPKLDLEPTLQPTLSPTVSLSARSPTMQPEKSLTLMPTTLPTAGATMGPSDLVFDFDTVPVNSATPIQSSCNFFQLPLIPFSLFVLLFLMG